MPLTPAVVRQSAAASAMKACLTAYIAPKKPFNGVLCTDNLPFVDIFKDKGIWVCLDEGCNSNCHVVKWRENVASKLQLRRLSPYIPGNAGWISRDSRVYSGIGGSKVITHGKWSMPGVLMGQHTGRKHALTFESNEQDGDHPMLLSQSTQT